MKVIRTTALCIAWTIALLFTLPIVHRLLEIPLQPKTGLLYGLLNAQRVIEGENGQLAFITLDATTPNTLVLHSSGAWSYRQVRMKIATSEQKEVRLEVRTSDLHILTKSDATVAADTLTPELLAVIAGIELGPAESKALKGVHEVVQLVVQAGHGQLPPPRHSPYFENQPEYGSLTHFTLGMPLYGLASLVIWFLGLVTIVVVTRRSRRSSVSSFEVVAAKV